MPSSRVVTGAKLLCYINGSVHGQVTKFSFEAMSQKKEIRTVDVLHPLELAPGQTTVRGTIRLVRLMGDSGAQGAGLLAQQAFASREKYFTLLVTERLTDMPYFKADFCSGISETWDVDAGRGIAMGTLEFEAIIYNNEATLIQDNSV